MYLHDGQKKILHNSPEETTVQYNFLQHKDPQMCNVHVALMNPKIYGNTINFHGTGAN